MTAAASARGLFRATGKASAPVSVAAGEDLAGAFERPEFLEREKDDFYPTPPEPTRALLSAELPRLSHLGGVWEPAAGDGAMVRELVAVGLPVDASDLVDRGSREDLLDLGCRTEIRSFYEYHTAPQRAIVTNPPFAECNKDPGWVRHALEKLDVEYMALLLPINWLGAASRAALWAEFPPARIYLMRWRIDFTGQGAPPMLNAWFVWDKTHVGETVLRMLDRKDARQGEMF